MHFFVCDHLSVPGPDRRGEGEGERLHNDPGGRTGELQISGSAVEDAAGSHLTGAARHHAGVSVYMSDIYVRLGLILHHMS